MSMTCLALLALSLACFLTASGTVFVAGYAPERWSVTVLPLCKAADNAKSGPTYPEHAM